MGALVLQGCAHTVGLHLFIAGGRIAVHFIYAHLLLSCIDKRIFFRLIIIGCYWFMGSIYYGWALSLVGRYLSVIYIGLVFVFYGVVLRLYSSFSWRVSKVGNYFRPAAGFSFCISKSCVTSQSHGQLILVLRRTLDLIGRVRSA